MIGPCSKKCHYMENMEYAFKNVKCYTFNRPGKHAAILNTIRNCSTVVGNYVFKPIKTKKMQRRNMR